ncbi:MAG: EamA family transporter [Acidobacteriota bacterium]
MSTLVLGTVTGLAAAVAFALAYLAGRAWTVKHGGQALGLFMITHAMAAVVALPVACWQWPEPAVRANALAWLLPLLACKAGYLGGQLCLILALHREEASRVGPLLGLKIIFVPLLSWAILGDAQRPLQWLAVLLALASAFALSRVGGRVSLKALLAALGAALGYAVFDVHAQQLIDVLQPGATAAQSTRVATWCVSVVLVTSGALSLLGLALRRRPSADWRAALPHAAASLMSLYLLFVTFGLVGIVYGNILIASRSLMGIALGALVARLGHHHLEEPASPSVVARRTLAAGFLAVAIVLHAAHDRITTWLMS